VYFQDLEKRKPDIVMVNKEHSMALNFHRRSVLMCDSRLSSKECGLAGGEIVCEKSLCWKHTHSGALIGWLVPRPAIDSLLGKEIMLTLVSRLLKPQTNWTYNMECHSNVSINVGDVD
jgi:hypothetical protein